MQILLWYALFNLAAAVVMGYLALTAPELEG